MSEHPNILFITAEDISPHLGCYGDCNATTPHLDKFAAAGLRFTNVFSVHPCCSPSRSCLATGVYPTRLGTFQHRARMWASRETMVIFLGDNGMGIPAGKIWLWEQGLHVPMLMRIPAKWRHLYPNATGHVETISSLLTFPDAIIRREAVYVLVRIGELARPLLSELSQSLEPSPHADIWSNDNVAEAITLLNACLGEPIEADDSMIPYQLTRRRNRVVAMR